MKCFHQSNGIYALRFSARPEIYNIHKYIRVQQQQRHHRHSAHRNSSHIKYKVSYVFMPYTQIETISPKYFIDSVDYWINLIIPYKHHHKVGKQISNDKYIYMLTRTHTFETHSQYNKKSRNILRAAFGETFSQIQCNRNFFSFFFHLFFIKCNFHPVKSSKTQIRFLNKLVTSQEKINHL